MRLSYYSIRYSYNSKLKFVDKSTHFVGDIGNFVNKTSWIFKIFKKNLLSTIDNSGVGFAHPAKWPNCGSCDTCFCEWPDAWVWDIYWEYVGWGGKNQIKSMLAYFYGRAFFISLQTKLFSRAKLTKFSFSVNNRSSFSVSIAIIIVIW